MHSEIRAADCFKESLLLLQAADVLTKMAADGSVSLGDRVLLTWARNYISDIIDGKNRVISATRRTSIRPSYYAAIREITRKFDRLPNKFMLAAAVLRALSRMLLRNRI